MIGKGTFSEVYEGSDLTTNARVVIKELKTSKARSINKEIMILKHLQGGPNILKLLDVIRDSEEEVTSLVTELIDTHGLKPSELYLTLTDFEIRFYIYQGLRAIDYSHSKGVMHRDLKPGNVMIDHEIGQL